MNSTSQTTRVIVIGGTGVFGSRLVARLRSDPRLDVRTAGRGTGNDIRLDRTAPDLAAHLAQAAPQIVIDAAGPFQGGADPYAVARAAIDQGAHYLDLSDDAAFTAGITTLDDAARAAGVTVMSGVSTVPGISSAAVEAMIDGFDDIHLIDSALVPGNQAPRGLAVMQSILAQAGRPTKFWQAGRAQSLRAWGDLRRIDIAGLGKRWVSTIGAPDIALFPARYRARSVRFGAGLELSIMHLGLWAMALPVRWGLVPTLRPLARPIRTVAGLFERLGSDRGGMRTRVIGTGATGAEIRDWVIYADRGDGPIIPALPGQVMVGKILSCSVAPGATPCVGAFTLADLAAVSGDLAVTTRRVDTPLTPVFQSALGPSFDNLPPTVQDLHRVLAHRRWSGTGRVDRGRGPLVALVCALMRFPRATPETPVTVTMERRGETETWVRSFGSSRFRSHLRAAGTPGDGVVTERFGALTFRIGLKVVDGALTYPVLSGRCGPIPIPKILLPRSETVEAGDGDAMTFDVAVSLPIIGRIVRYRGRLTSDEAP